MFTVSKTAYHRFLSLANQLPVVYLPKSRSWVEGSLLIPDIPVSEGKLMPLQFQLGEVDGPIILPKIRTAS